MKFKEGSDRSQPTLFPPILDDYVTEENPVRVIDAFVDSLKLSEMGFTQMEDEEKGRPPYSPYDMLKLYIYGYFNKVRSSRKLEAETHRNVEVMWLINNLKPDHKTISRFRKDNLKPIKKVFNSFVKLCLKLGLYSRKLISIDGSYFAGVNSKERSYSTDKLQERIRRIDEHISEYLTDLETSDSEDEQIPETENVKAIVETLRERKTKHEEMLNKINETQERQISVTDPDSHLLAKLNTHIVGYNIQTAVDSQKSLIVDFDVINTTDRGHMHDLAAKCKDVLEVDSLSSLADKGYVSATDIANCLADGITANVCMDEKCLSFCIETDETHEKPQTYENGRIVYLKSRNVCVCPMGELLYPSSYNKSHRCARYMNSKACAGCAQKCTISRCGVGEVAMKKSDFSKEYNIENLKLKPIRYVPDKALLKRRKSLSEHPFGFVKRCLGADYFLLKRFAGVTAETAFAFLVFNMKRAINILGIKRLIESINAT